MNWRRAICAAHARLADGQCRRSGAGWSRRRNRPCHRTWARCRGSAGQSGGVFSALIPVCWPWRRKTVHSAKVDISTSEKDFAAWVASSPTRGKGRVAWFSCLEGRCWQSRNGTAEARFRRVRGEGQAKGEWSEGADGGGAFGGGEEIANTKFYTRCRIPR